MMRGLLQRCGKPQHGVGVFAGCNFHRHQSRAADGQCSRLVEHHGVGARQRFERLAALDEDAEACGARDAGDKGDRCGEDQRTWRCRDQHREGAHRIARDRPCGAGDGNARWKQQQGEAIGEPDERSPGGLGGIRHSHDAGIGAFAGKRRRSYLESLTGIDCAAARGFAFAARHRDRFAGQRRLVDQGFAQDHAVDRNDFAAAHQKDVADGGVVDRDVRNRAVLPAMRRARGAVDQRPQIAFGARDGKIFQHVAAGIHQRDDGAGEVFAERERRRHRHESDRVDTQPARHEVADHGDEKAGRDRKRAGGPEPARNSGPSARPCREAKPKAGEGNDNERAAQDALCQKCSHGRDEVVLRRSVRQVLV